MTGADTDIRTDLWRMIWMPLPASGRWRKPDAWRKNVGSLLRRPDGSRWRALWPSFLRWCWPCAALLAGLVVVLLMGYVRLTEVTADITQLKREMSQQEERHVALLTQYEKTFDLATVKRVAEEEGMKKPIGGQVEYLELPASDSAVVYRSDAGTALESIASAISDAAKTVVEYFR